MGDSLSWTVVQSNHAKNDVQPNAEKLLAFLVDLMGIYISAKLQSGSVEPS